MKATQVNPEPLGRGRNLVLEFSTSLLLFLLTIPLFVFAVVVARLDGRELARWEVVEQISRILANALPIWFALVVGRAIRHFAAWRLERGVKLRSLEQLMGSLTVGGTLITAFSLRILNGALILLIVGWSLSPLGGQSSLQMIYILDEPVTRSQELRYLDTVFRSRRTDTFPVGEAFYGGSMARSISQFLDIMYNTCMLSPASVRDSPVDPWNNVKVPDLRRLSARVSPTEAGWFNISIEKTTDIQKPLLDYSSLIGIPTTLIASEGENAAFTIESAYLSLSCPELKLISTEELKSAECPPMEFSTLNANRTIWSTGRNPLRTDYYGPWNFSTDTYAQDRPFGHVYIFGNESDDLIVPPSRLNFHSSLAYSPSSNEYYHLQACCALTTEYVETAITCHGKACLANAIRPSRIPHPPRNLTDLGFGASNFYATGYMTTPSNGALVNHQSSTTEIYLSEPNKVSTAMASTVDYSNLGPEDFAIRFQQLLNTYWYGSYSTPTYVGGFGSDTLAQRNLTTMGTFTTSRKVYRVRWVWWSIFLLSVSVMAVSCIAAAIFGGMTSGPQILGYCSTLLAAYPLVKRGYGEGTWMGGAQRTRVFGDTQVRLVDLAANRDIGFIAVAGEQIDDDGVVCGAVERSDRVYQ